MKALALSFVADGDQPELLAEFRGVRAHDYGWLLGLYRHHGGPPLPQATAASVARVGRVWTTGLRYNPSTKLADAEALFRDVQAVLDWASERV